MEVRWGGLVRQSSSVLLLSWFRFLASCDALFFGRETRRSGGNGTFERPAFWPVESTVSVGRFNGVKPELHTERALRFSFRVLSLTLLSIPQALVEGPWFLACRVEYSMGFERPLFTCTGGHKWAA